MLRLFPQKNCRGFSLIEVLAVMAIGALMMGLAVPSARMFGGAGRERQALIEISGLLESARMTSVTQNTFVYVLFHENASANGTSVLRAIAMISEDGSDVLSDQTEYHATSDGGLRALGREVTVNDYRWVLDRDEAGNVASEVARPLATDYPASTTTVQVRRGDQTTAYTHLVKFLPTGEARGQMQSLTERLEFGLKNNLQEDASAAIFQISGLTGQNHVHRLQ